MKYTVKPTDSLTSISEEVYGDFDQVKAIMEANKLTERDVIYPGMVLTLPDLAGPARPVAFGTILKTAFTIGISIGALINDLKRDEK